MRLPRFLALAATGALVLAMGIGPAHAVDPSRGRPGFCPTANGVTVVVDFQALGGDVVIRCAPGAQKTGVAALLAAGIEVTGVQRWGLAFTCRLEGKPSARTESCVDTPPPNAYWSYWHAPNGGSWASSQYGALNRKPPVGSFEGWSFSLNRTAGSNPPPRIAPRRPGQPVGAPPPKSDQDGSIPGRDGVPTASVVPKRSPGPTTVAPNTTAPTAGASGISGAGQGGVRWTGGEAGASENAEFPWTALIGGLGALALGSVAGFLAWRRRRRANS